jgi:tetratricopeptide (TPR) repeat protein
MGPWIENAEMRRLLEIVERVAPPATRPELYFRLWGSLRGKLGYIPRLGLEQALIDAQRFGEGEWGAIDELEELGHELLKKHYTVGERRRGCIWLTMFPSAATATAMARILADPSEPAPLRDQAAWTLGYRQLQQKWEGTLWPERAVVIADDALADAWRAGAWRELHELVPAIRHVQGEVVHAALAATPPEGATQVYDALECFLQPDHARTLLGRLPEIPAAHAPRLIRLIGHTLSAEAGAPLLEYAKNAPVTEKHEALSAAFAVDPERGRGPIEDFAKGLAFPQQVRTAITFFEANPGIFPSVRALRVGRTTAALPLDLRDGMCARACPHFVMAMALGLVGERALREIWRHVAWAARHEAPHEVIRCVEGVPSTLEQAPFLVVPYLEALAAAGRFGPLEETAALHGAADEAAWLLARSARPFRALATRRLAPVSTPAAVTAQALALFLAGRPDLADKTLHLQPPSPRMLAGVRPSRDPRAATRPGANEMWWANRDAPHHGPLRALLEPDLPALLGAMQPPPTDAEPDVIDVPLIERYERALRQELADTTVFLVGDFADRAALEARLEARGARIVSGPFAGTDYYMVGDGAAVPTLAKLKTLGALPLPASALDDNASKEPDSMPVAAPYRVSMLAPVLQLPAGAEALAGSAAILLYITVFENLVRHPVVSLTDPDDFHMADGDNRLWTRDHPNVEPLLGNMFSDDRRDEIFWFELALDPQAQAVCKLKVENDDCRVDEYVAMGAPTQLSTLIESCMSQWLQARNVPPLVRPLEPFGTQDFLAVAQKCQEVLVAGQRDPEAARPQLQNPPPRLMVPFFRFAYVTLELPVFEPILRIEPDNPWARRDAFLDKAYKGPEPPRDEIRAIIQMCPQWGKPYISMWGPGISDDEFIYFQSIASTLLPGNPWPLSNYANGLFRANRHEECYRVADRCTRLSATFIKAHYRAIDGLSEACRFGSAVRESLSRNNFVDQKLIPQNAVDGGDPDVCFLRLRIANNFKEIGRLDEAIQVRDGAIKAVARPEDWPQQTELLQKWQSDPALVAQSYAREGFHRGDPGRVLDGFARAPIDGGADIARLIHSLIALGKEDLALLACAHYEGQKASRHPLARMARAKALIANGQLARGLREVQALQLAFCQGPYGSEVNRLLRLAAARPPAEWEEILSEKQAAGARRLAKLLARDAADFVPGMEQSKVVRDALAGGDAVPFQQAWVQPLHDAIAKNIPLMAPMDAIDGFFDGISGTTLADADKLAGNWYGQLAPEREGDRTRDAQLVYLLACSLCRYLALTTQAPNVLAGGYRQVATDVLSAISGRPFPATVLRPFFQALEAAAAGADPWMFDTWLLRVERALELDYGRGGHLNNIIGGLPHVTAFLRGDERIALELRTAQELQKEGQYVDARDLYLRSVRAIGSIVSADWSDVTDLASPPQMAIDSHWTATLVHPAHGGPAVNLARALFAAGKGPQAFEVLVGALGFGGKSWRENQLAKLKPLYDAAKLPVPFDWSASSTQAMTRMQQNDFAGALDCLRWCNAIDPNNAVTLRNLGIAYARVGKTYEALVAFGQADAHEGPKWAGQALREAQKLPEAVAAYRYASLYFRSADEWLALAGCAWYVEDNETASEAYARVHQLGPQSMDLSQLNAYAVALYESGQYAACEPVARQVYDMSRGDPTYASLGLHAMARTMLGMGRFPEALQCATQATQLNPLPDNQKAFGETLSHAQRSERFPLPDLKSAEKKAQAWTAIRGSDFKTALAIASTGENWGLWRAMVAASEFRYESDNQVPVAPYALEVAARALDGTAGQTDVDAILCRVHALRVLEDANYPVDAPPPLGARIPRERLDQLINERTARRPGQAPSAQQVQAAQVAQAAVQTGAAGDPDPLVFPGSKLPKLSDYVRVMKGMQSGNMMGTLSQAGLDMQTYGQLAMMWGQKMAADPVLTAKFTKMMQGG